MSIAKRNIFLPATLLLICLFWATQSGAQSILDTYIKEGLESNLTLKQQELSYEKSREAFKEARSFFFPEVAFNSRFTISRGGRVDEFPLNETIDPIHSTLNDLLAANGEPAAFVDPVDNPQLTFLRPYEQETKGRIVQPIFAPEVFVNARIKKDLITFEEANLDAAKQNLIAEIKTAYYNYLIALEAIKIFEQADEILQGNVRISRSLVENGKVTGEVVFRIQADLSDLEADLQRAEKDKELSKSYFNFLLNRALDADVVVDTLILDKAVAISSPDLLSDMNQALVARSEINQLHLLNNINRETIRLRKSAYFPTLTGIFDVGYQGPKFRVTNESGFYRATINLQWNVFSFYQQIPKIKQAKIDLMLNEIKTEETEKQIQLEVKEAYYNVLEAEKNIQSAKDKSVSAQKNYDIVQKKFEQSRSSHIDLLDARSVLTQSQIQVIISRYTYLIQQANYEKITASYQYLE